MFRFFGALAVLAAGLRSQPRFVVGVCTHFEQGKGILAANLDLIRQAGVASIRDEVSWSGVERQPGQFAMPDNWNAYVRRAVETGVAPLLILDYGNRAYDRGDKPLSDAAMEGFARYAEFVVRHFKGTVHLYEIWNEWDIGIGGTTAGEAEPYARLLKAVYPRIKAIDPSILIMGGAATSGGIRKGWLERMMAAGGLAALDAVSIHTYNYSAPDRGRTPEAWAEFVVGVETSIHKYSRGGADLPVYVTEMGWPTHAGPRSTSPEQSAAYLARMFLLGRSLPYLKGIWWYDFQDDGWRAEYNEHNFGVVRPDLTGKPAYYALSAIAKLAAEAEFVGRLETADPDLWVLKFRLQGQDVLALWRAMGAPSGASGASQAVAIATTAAGTPAQITEVGRPAVPRAWGLRDWAGGSGSSGAALVPNQLSVAPGEMPLLVAGTDLRLAGQQQ